MATLLFMPSDLSNKVHVPYMIQKLVEDTVQAR